MTEKKIFDRMMDPEVRKSFCAHKGEHFSEDTPEYKDLTDYILSDECERDILRLKSGDYYIAVPIRFKIRKINSEKRRICYKYPSRDSYILKLMTYVLMDYDYLYSDSLYSFRKNINHRHFFHKLKRVDFDRKLYVYKTDVHAYGESVDQDILLDILKPVFQDDPEFYDFLYWIIKRNQYIEKGVLRNERISIIQGTPFGQFLNNVYLMDMDKYLEKHSVLYMRYADDIAVFTNTYEEAAAANEYITRHMQSKKLELNASKTNIYNPGESLSLLGIEISPSEFDIAPVSLGKIIFKVKHKSKGLMMRGRKYAIPGDELLNIGIRYMNNFFFGKVDNGNELSWTTWAFGIINTTKTLEYIDSTVQNCLRSIGSGKTGNARYRISYNNLKKAGYKSLVHSYYHYYETKEGRTP